MSGEPGALADGWTVQDQAILSGGWLVISDIFSSEKLTFIPVKMKHFCQLFLAAVILKQAFLL